MPQTNETVKKLRKIIKAVRERKPFFRPEEVKRLTKQQMIVAGSRKRRDYDRHMVGSPELTYSEITKIERECFQKEWKSAGIKMTLAALGLATVIGGGAKALSSTMPEKDNNNTRVEVEYEPLNQESKENEFVKGLQESAKQEVDEKAPDLTPEEKAVMESDAVINAIVNAYNEKYDTNVSSSKVKVLHTDPIYVSKSADGDYVLDEWRYWDVDVLDAGTGSVYTLIDGETNEIIYSAMKKGKEFYDINTHIIKSWDNEEFVDHHEQGDFLRASEITFDKKIQGDRTNQELAFDAIGIKIDRVLHPEKYETKQVEKGEDIDR